MGFGHPSSKLPSVDYRFGLPGMSSTGTVPNAYATWALILGVLAVLCVGAGPVLGLLAIVLGVLGHGQVQRSGGRMGGAGMATFGILAGALAFVLFLGAVGLYLSTTRRAYPWRSGPASKNSNAPVLALPAEPPAAPSGAPSNVSPPANTTAPAPTASSSVPAAPSGGPSANPSDPPADPLSSTSAVTTLGAITIVDVAAGVASLARELKDQRSLAEAHGERMVVETIASSCPPCDGVASALGDPRMQDALKHIRLVRVDRDQFQDELDELSIPSSPYPGFFLLDSSLNVTDGINGGEWDADVAINIAPVLGPFVRGIYSKRRTPWKGTPRPSGTVL
jgi:hypothetical protein